MSDPKDITVRMTEKEYRNYLTYKEGIKAKAEVWVDVGWIHSGPFRQDLVGVIKFMKEEAAIKTIIDYCNHLKAELEKERTNTFEIRRKAAKEIDELLNKKRFKLF